MKKIGIVTFIHCINYGAYLQAFALKEYLSLLNHNVKIINYTPKIILFDNLFYFLISQNKHIKNNIYKPLKFLFDLPTFLKRFNINKVNKFNKFSKKQLSLSKLIKNPNEVNNLKIETIIIGSDQVWNDKMLERVDDIFFAKKINCSNIISYAPSLGKSRFELQNEKEIKNSLQKLSAISIREQSNIPYLKDLLDRNIKCVLDPTFLLTKQYYEHFADKYKIKIKNKYIFIYSLGYFNILFDIAEKININNEYKIIVVDLYSTKKNKKYKYMNSIGPGEFLYLIKNAEYVITNSFHGTALSIIFEKEFFTYITQRKDRITNILNLSGLDNRLVNDKLNFSVNKIDYNKVKEKLKPYIEYSKNYLKENI